MHLERFHLAQTNIAKMRAPIDDPVIEGFVSQLEFINSVADESPRFVWRPQTEKGDATAIRVSGFSSTCPSGNPSKRCISMSIAASMPARFAIASSGSSQWIRPSSCCGGFQPVTFQQWMKRRNVSRCCESSARRRRLLLSSSSFRLPRNLLPQLKTRERSPTCAAGLLKFKKSSRASRTSIACFFRRTERRNQ